MTSIYLKKIDRRNRHQNSFTRKFNEFWREKGKEEFEKENPSIFIDPEQVFQ